MNVNSQLYQSLQSSQADKIKNGNPLAIKDVHEEEKSNGGAGLEESEEEDEVLRQIAAENRQTGLSDLLNYIGKDT